MLLLRRISSLNLPYLVSSPCQKTHIIPKPPPPPQHTHPTPHPDLQPHVERKKSAPIQKGVCQPAPSCPSWASISPSLCPSRPVSCKHTHTRRNCQTTLFPTTKPPPPSPHPLIPSSPFPPSDPQRIFFLKRSPYPLRMYIRLVRIPPPRVGKGGMPDIGPGGGLNRTP